LRNPLTFWLRSTTRTVRRRRTECQAATSDNVHVPADQVLEVARREDGRSFDAPDAEFTHQDNLCTFEVLIDAFNLGGDPALLRLARIVHAADIAQDLDSDPLGPGLLAIGEGGLDVEADDQRLLEKGSFVYDALYAWCQRHADQPVSA
jgi:hypothetical protein